jgi:hypothetical protein
MNLFALDIYAQDLMHERMAEADNARLIALLPHTTPAVQVLGAAARAHVADGLRVLARRLDPTVAPEFQAGRSDGRLVIARSR